MFKIDVFYFHQQNRDKLIMRFKAIALSGLILTSACSAFVSAAPLIYNIPSARTAPDDKHKGMFGQLNLGLLYSYTDFKLNSQVGSNYNNFKGHSNLYGVGGDNVILLPSVSAGVYIYGADTSINSAVFLSPGLPTTAGITIRNKTLFGHMLKSFTKYVLVDVSGAVGQNKSTIHSIIGPNIVDTQYGSANSRSGNWFASVAGIYSKPWKRFILSSNVRLLYSQVNNKSYLLTYQPTMSPQFVAALTNKIFFVMENAEVGYKYKPNVTPFLNAGLIQLAHYSNSYPSVITAINGSLPQLNMNKNGYKLGAGIGFSYKKLAIRVEEQYYNAGGSYTSYQTLVGLRYVIT